MIRNIVISGIIIALSNFLFAQSKVDRLKKTSILYIDQNQDKFTNWSDQIWQFAENSFQDTLSANLLMDVLHEEGFQVETEIAGCASMFVATYGHGKPVIGLFGEYDGDPGASNEVAPFRKPILEQRLGHGAGHNLLGVGSLASALAIKELMRKEGLNGTIKYFGSTSEGGLGGRSYFARDGYFDDLDFSLYWHPSPVTAVVTRSWDAMIEMEILFTGKASPAIRKPEQGRNAMHAVVNFLEKLQELESKQDQNRRVNYSINTSNQDLRFIPDTVMIKMRIQHPEQLKLIALFGKIKKWLIETKKETTIKIDVNVKRAFHEFIPNNTASKLVYQNMQQLAPISYTQEEEVFARQMQAFLEQPIQPIQNKVLPFRKSPEEKILYGYVSDIGDASWFTPEVYFVTTIIPSGIPMHDWPTTAFTAHSIAHKGMIYAAKVMANTIIDYLNNAPLQRAIREEFEERVRPYSYQTLLGPGAPPIQENAKAN